MCISCSILTFIKVICSFVLKYCRKKLSAKQFKKNKYEIEVNFGINNLILIFFSLLEIYMEKLPIKTACNSNKILLLLLVNVMFFVIITNCFICWFRTSEYYLLVITNFGVFCSVCLV